MAKTKKYIHIVSTFDTDNRVIKFDLCESDNEIDVIGENPIDLLDFEISELIGDDPQRAKSIVGKLVLELINSLVDGGIGIPEETQESEAEIKADNALKELAQNGDASVKNTLGFSYMIKSFKYKDINYLTEADYWYKEAAKDGNKEAIEFLEKHWDEEKDRIKNKILNDL